MSDDALASQLAEAVSAQSEIADHLKELVDQLGPVVLGLSGERRAKDSVKYRVVESGPRCGTCVSFHSDGKCRKVAGTIDPNAVCELHEPRTQIVERTQIGVQGG